MGDHLAAQGGGALLARETRAPMSTRNLVVHLQTHGGRCARHAHRSTSLLALDELGSKRAQKHGHALRRDRPRRPSADPSNGRHQRRRRRRWRNSLMRTCGSCRPTAFRFFNRLTVPGGRPDMALFKVRARDARGRADRGSTAKARWQARLHLYRRPGGGHRAPGRTPRRWRGATGRAEWTRSRPPRPGAWSTSAAGSRWG